MISLSKLKDNLLNLRHRRKGSKPLPSQQQGSGEGEGQGLVGNQQQLSQLDQRGALSQDQPDPDSSSPSNLKLYWCSFLTPGGEFVGVVVNWGKSPGAAANRSIKAGIVECERARVVEVPEEHWLALEGYVGRLLTEQELRENPPAIGELKFT